MSCYPSDISEISFLFMKLNVANNLPCILYMFLLSEGGQVSWNML